METDEAFAPIASLGERHSFALGQAWSARSELVAGIASGLAGVAIATLTVRPFNAQAAVVGAVSGSLAGPILLFATKYLRALIRSTRHFANGRITSLEIANRRLIEDGKRQREHFARERVELQRRIDAFNDLTPRIHGIAVSDERKLGGPGEFDLLVDITTKETTAFNDDWLLDLSWPTGVRVNGVQGRIAIAHQFPVGRMPLTVTFPYTQIGTIPHIRTATLERLSGTDHRGRRVTFERRDGPKQLARVPEPTTAVEFSLHYTYAPEPDIEVVRVMVGVKNVGATDDFQIQVARRQRPHEPELIPMDRPHTVLWDGADSATTRRIVAGMTDFIEVARFYHAEPPPQFRELTGIAYLDAPWTEAFGAHPYVDIDSFTSRVWTIELVVSAANIARPLRQLAAFHVFWKESDDPTGKLKRIGWGPLDRPIMRMVFLPEQVGELTAPKDQ